MPRTRKTVKRAQNGATAPTGPLVKQSDLRDVLEWRLVGVDLRAHLESATRDLLARELVVKTALRLGGTVEPGPRLAAIAMDSRRCPSWLGEFVKRHGEAEADRVREATTPTVTERLVITVRLESR